MTTKQIALRIEAQGGQDAVRIAQTVENAVERMNKSAESGSDKAAVAKKREVQALLDYAAAARNAERAANDQASSVQARINAATGVTGGTNARASAAARTFEAAERGYDRRAQVLLETLNPLWAAQQKLNSEVAEYDALLKRSKITTDQHNQAVALSRQRYDETTAALNRQNKGLSRNVMASRLNLTRQGADVFTTAAMGMNPAMIAIQQGPQILDAWSTSAIKLTGPLTLLVGTTGLLAGATAAMAVAWAQAEKSSAALEMSVTGLGRTSGMSAAELKAAAAAGAEAGNISVSAAREMAIAYANTGNIGGEVMSGLVAVTKDFAAFMGVDAKAATEQLAKAMSEPDKAARDFTRQFGLLDQKTLDHIDNLIKLGDRTAAQKVLLEALTGAMSGHADKVDDLSSFWDVATRSMSNYWTRLGEWIQVTRDERIAKLEDAIENRPFLLPGVRGRLQNQLDDLRFERGYDAAKEENDQRAAIAKKAAQDARDREDAGKKDRDKAARDAERARREAERQARELLQRTRREEDVQSNLSLQEAKATNDLDRVRDLEAEARVRARIRQLEDDGVAAAQAKSRATQEEQRLLEAMKVQRDEEGLKLQRQGEMEVMRLLGEERSLRNLQDRIDHEERILAFQKAGYDLATATNLAEAQRNQLVKARAIALKRMLEDAQAEHRLNLARLSGDTETARWLDIEDRIQRRAREIEGRKSLNYGDGVDEAMSQIQQELNAEAMGARRAWVRDLVLDLKRARPGDVLVDQLDRATDKWLIKLSDALAGLKWGGAGKALLSGGGVAGAFSALFGLPGHSAGTDYSPGGWNWVGERGPELLNLPRGSRVLEHNRALQAASGSGAPQRVVVEVRAVKGDAFEPEIVRISSGVVKQGMAVVYGQSVDTSVRAAPSAVADARSYKG